MPEGEPAHPPPTSTHLLEALRDPANRTVWSHYVQRYQPLLERTARRAGLSAPEAEEVAQRTLVDFSTAYARGEYRRDKGRLGDWLFGILRNRLRERRRELAREASVGTGADGAPEPTAPAGLERLWEDEWSRSVIRQCTEIVRAEVAPRTFEAFRRFVLEGEDAEHVAAALATSTEAVYDAKRRVLRRLRELRPVIEESW